MSRSLLFGLAVLALSLPAAAQNSAVVEFDAGAQGWSINGLDTIVPTGGNPDEHIRYPNPIDTFGIAVRNSVQPAFLGDYGAKGEVTLSLDVKVEFIQFFGSPVPRELVVILYNDDIQGPSGSAGVWTSLGVLQGSGMPWTTFSAEVTDVTGAALPAGWGGVGDEDPGTFEPILPAGATWASVLADVDRIEFTTFVPGFFFGFTNFDVRVDNVSIQPLESTWVDLGSALAGVFGEPLLEGTGDLSSGTVSSVELSNAAPSATTGLFVGVSAINAPFKGGTLVPFPNLLFLLSTDAGGSLSVPFIMPAGSASGVEIYVQAGIQDGAAPVGVALSNAIVGTTP